MEGTMNACSAKAWPAEAFDAPASVKDLQAKVDQLTAALTEIRTICREDNATFRKRMGTRVGNVLVVAEKALGV
jgi:hypothetical protein